MNRIILILTVFTMGFCTSVSSDRALQVAENVFIQYHESHDLNNFLVSQLEEITSDYGTLIYLYHLEPIGFILISGHDSAVPSLGFSFESEFKLDGMIVVPTHKNCGFALDEKQADKFQKELVKSWGFEQEDD